MISYTVTTQKTQGQYRRSFTNSFGFTVDQYAEGAGAEDFFDFGNGVWIETGAYAFTGNYFTSSDGGSSISESFTSSATGVTPGESPEFSFSNTYTRSLSRTIDNNLAATEKGAQGASGFYNENIGDENPDGTTNFDYGGPYTALTTLTPTTVSGITTTTQNQERFIRTTQTGNGGNAVGTTTLLSSSTFPTTRAVLSESTEGVLSFTTKNFVTTTTQEIATNLVTGPGRFPGEEVFIFEPPRDTATAFDFAQGALGSVGPESVALCVWVPTATSLDSAGPWALTDIASSHTTNFTALPLYFTSPLKVLDESEATFPEPPENPETITEMRVALSQIGQDTRTIWTTHSRSGFPLESRNAFDPKFTTYESEHTYTTFTENNPLLTVAATEIGGQFSNSAEIKHLNFAFQEFYEFSYLTTRYLGTWSATSSTSYAGPATRGDGENTITFVNLDIAFAEGVTIEGTNVEQIQIRAFSPCAVSHNETSFTQAWGLHGNDGPQPVSQISFDGELSVRRTDFAELFPGVSVPYPTTYSWRTGNSTLSASLAGNAITVTTSFGTTSDSSSYEFSGSESAHTEQRTGREFFTNLQGLPALSFFGPHAATGSVETRARPGELVSIVQDSLGDFTLETITNETTSASTISENAVVFPGEKSFYTTTGGAAFLTFSRNPIP